MSLQTTFVVLVYRNFWLMTGCLRCRRPMYDQEEEVFVLYVVVTSTQPINWNNDESNVVWSARHKQ